ncbi:MAG: DUF5666 domain-containing protein [Caldilineaceae bacterium]
MNSEKVANKGATKLWVLTTAGILWLALLGAVVFNWHIVQAAPMSGGNGSDWQGIISARPPSGPVGIWVIGGRTFKATPATQIKEQQAGLPVNGCAKVKFTIVGQTNQADEIEGHPASDCNAQATETPEPTETPDGGHGTIPPDDNGNVSRGIINSRPHPGVIGTWVISGTSYAVTANTRLDRNFGPLSEGTCVQVKSDPSTIPTLKMATALWIKAKQRFLCNPDDGNNGGGNHGNPGIAHGTLFGVIESFPVTLTGTWRIGGLNVIADSSTKFNQDRGLFAVSTTVKVDFYIDITTTLSNTNALVIHAQQISTLFVDNHHGHGDDDNGGHQGAEGQAFGPITRMPVTGTVGVWVIGGVEYTVTNQTEIHQKRGALKVGAQVKVEYFLDSNNNRIAHEIETTFNNGGVSDTSHAKLVGFVEEMPTGSYTGTWKISNVTFTADGNTKFNEEHGALAKGSFVSVEYTVTNGINVMLEIENEIPPGCGEHNHIGKIEDMGGDGLAAASVSANTVWKIGGQNYTITPATTMNDTQGALGVNQTVAVNSYTAADGTQVATQIQSVSLTNQLYLPMVRK